MKPHEMAADCIAAMAERGDSAEGAFVTFVITRPGTPKGFPRGELLNEMRRDGRVERTMRYPAGRVLDWLVRNGLVAIASVKREGGKIVVTVKAPA